MTLFLIACLFIAIIVIAGGMNLMPSSAITRFELSMPFSEFNLAENRKGYIGPQVMRPFLTAEQAADIGKITLENLLTLNLGSTARAPGAGYSRTDFEFTKFSYSTEEYGKEHVFDDAQLAIFRSIIDAESVGAERATTMVLEEYERDVATAIYDTATWTGSSLTTAITNEWDDAANATPIQDVIAAREKVVSGSGLEPNALIMNAFQYRHLCNCNQIVERVKYTALADQKTMMAAVAEVLGVEKLIVAGLKGAGVKNTALPGQTASISRIWSNEYMMLARVATSDDPQEPCIGRTFIFSGDGPGSPGTEEELAVIAEEYREESRRGSVIRARNNRDIVVMYAEAGHLFSNAIT